MWKNAHKKMAKDLADEEAPLKPATKFDQLNDRRKRVAIILKGKDWKKGK